jgi:hypothetical protein
MPKESGPRQNAAGRNAAISLNLLYPMSVKQSLQNKIRQYDRSDNSLHCAFFDFKSSSKN